MRKYYFGLGVLSLLAVGCGDRDDALETAPQIVDRAKLGGELLFIDQTQSLAYALDVMADEPSASAERIKVAAEPALALERTQADEVLVLCGGKRSESGDWAETPQLDVIDAKHQVRSYEFTVPFSQVEVTGDGRYALLYRPNDEDDSASLLSDPNRVALVDLEREPSENNPVERTLKAIGGELAQVYLFDAIQILDETRPIGLFTFADGLSVWDLAHPERSEIASEGLGVNGTVSLTRRVSDPSSGKLYFIQSGLSDLRVLDLNHAASSGKENDFWPSWNQLPLNSTSSTDLVLYSDADEPRVIVAGGSALEIIDSDDSRVVQVSVPDSEFVTAFYSFVGTSPNDDNSKQRLLGWASGTSSVTFIELEELESRGTRNMEVLELGYSLSRVLPLSDTELLTVLDYGGIGVLDLQSRRFRPLSSSFDLTAPIIQSDSARVWVGGESGIVGYFAPSTLETWSMRLDAPIEEMFLFENESNRKVIVSHASSWGQATIVDGNTPSRATATVVDGFMLDGVVK